MEPTTDLVLRSKSTGIVSLCVPRARRNPTPLDWERWAPAIAARYKSEPARVLISEMDAEGLLVTEKMFRDRIRLWGMNKKNRRGASSTNRRTLQPSSNRNKTSRPGSYHTTTYRSSSQPTMLDHQGVHNILKTPKEELVLQRTLKGVLDWQEYSKGSPVDLDYTRHNTQAFVTLVLAMEQCLYVSFKNPFSCEKITPQLRRMSAELQSHMEVICTPPAIFRSINVLSYLACSRDTNPWYDETSRFLINAAVEAFPESPPSLLLLHLVLGNLTPPKLVMMYEVGAKVTEQCYGEVTAFQLRVAMHNAASRMDLGWIIRSYADAMCAATHDATDSERLYAIAKLHHSMGQYGKSIDALQRCLAQFEDEGIGDSPMCINALKFLASVQSKRNDFVGQEITLQKILKVTQARDRRELHTSQLSIDALDAISELDAFYRDHDLDEQRDALHLEYPSAFEL